MFLTIIPGAQPFKDKFFCALVAHALVISTFLFVSGSLQLTFSQIKDNRKPTDANLEAITEYGKIRGRLEDGIFAFRNIPYGADTKNTRFQPPAPPRKWQGVKDAAEYGNICPQQVAEKGLFFPDERRKMKLSEDCLNLNVWTPSIGNSGGTHKRPVMVYIHGGGYLSMSGNNDLYNGVRLCKKGDVVVVTINHRLNLFGFLYLAEIGGKKYAESGNVGMLDLVLALKWVKKNIAAFGGDAENVLIFGESGGGAKCATLMAMPSAKGLFHKVITESGQQLTGRNAKKATETALKVLKSLNISRDSLSALDTISVERLVAAIGTQSFSPVKDFNVLPSDPFEPDASPVSKDIPMIIGNNHDETRYLIGSGDTTLFSLTWETLPAQLEKNAGFMGDIDRAKVIKTYREWYPQYTASDVFFASTTASRSWKGMVIESERRARQNGAPTYVFQLNWNTPVENGRWKACHTLDIPLVFDNVKYGAQMTGTSPEAQRIADLMSGAWIAFAKTGNPDAPDLPHWEPFTIDKRATMVFDLKPALEYDPRGQERKLFMQVPYVQPGTK